MIPAVEVNVSEIGAIDENFPLGGIVKAAEQLDESGFASTVLANKSQAGSGRDSEVDVGKSRLLLLG